MFVLFFIQQTFSESGQPNSTKCLQNLWFFIWEGQEGRKTLQKSENSDIGVQSFDHNSETNQDIKNRNSSLTSTINSEVNDIWMSLNVFYLDLHRLVNLSNIFNFGNLNLCNSLTFELWSLHLLGFLFGTSNSIFPKNFIKIGSLVLSKTYKNPAWVRDYLRDLWSNSVSPGGLQFLSVDCARYHFRNWIIQDFESNIIIHVDCNISIFNIAILHNYINWTLNVMLRQVMPRQRHIIVTSSSRHLMSCHVTSCQVRARHVRSSSRHGYVITPSRHRHVT